MSRTLRTESGAPVADNQNSQTAGPARPGAAAGPAPAREARALQPRADPGARRARGGLGRLRPLRGHEPRRLALDAQRHARRGRQAHAGLRALLDRGRLAGRAGRRARPARLRAEVLHRGRQLRPRRATTRRSSSSATRIKFPDFIHSPEAGPATPTRRSPTTSGTSSRSRPRPPTSSPGCSATAASRPRCATWTASARTPSSGSTPQGERFWVKFHFKTDQGIRCLTSEEAARIGGENPQHHQQDLCAADRARRVPVVDAEGAGHAGGGRGDYRFNPFDLTKVWPTRTTR